MHIRLFKEVQRTKFTRMCIGEAIILLLQKEKLEQLKVKTVAQKAGVSRMTFYKYYETLQAALKDYLNIIISEYLEEMERADENEFLSYQHILFSIQFFDKYRQYFVTMKKQGLYSVLIDSVNEFIPKYIHTNHKMSIYKLYSYAGSLLNTFLMWEEKGREDSAEEVAGMMYQLYG